MNTTKGPGRKRESAEEVTRLVRLAAGGDKEGWDGLLDEFGGMIWAIARAHRLRDDDAADVTQATWLRLLEHLADLKDHSRVGPWLATTARRECLRVLRGTRRHSELGESLPEPESGDTTPEAELLIAERDEALWRSFNALPEGDQALLRLLMAEPRPSYEEISASLGMPIGSIGPTRARGLERLRRALDRDGTLDLMAA